jgi:Gas vesicle protein G
MGLFTALLTLPIAPVRGVVWVAEQVADEADRQLYDEDRILAELLQLEIDSDEGKLGDEERQRIEDDLFERLAVAQARKAAPDYEQDEEFPAPESRNGYTDG